MKSKKTKRPEFLEFGQKVTKVDWDGLQTDAVVIQPIIKAVRGMCVYPESETGLYLIATVHGEVKIVHKSHLRA